MTTNQNNTDFFAWYAALLVVLVGLFVGIVSAVVSQSTQEAPQCPSAIVVEETLPGQSAATPSTYSRTTKSDCPPEQRVALTP